MIGIRHLKRGGTIALLAGTVSSIASASPALGQGTPPTQAPTSGEAQLPTDPNVAPAPIPADTGTAKVYTPVDFARFAPKTALDMVAQVPGFVIQGGDNGQRGLGEAKQNVLINGQRVSGKSNDAATALGRIPADAVIRIEIVDGATLDVPGLSGQVANVFVKSSKFDGTFRWTPTFRKRLEDAYFGGEIALSGRLGTTNWTAGVTNEANRSGNFGPEVVTDGNGDLLFTRHEHAAFYSDAPKLSTSLNRTAGNGNILNANAAYQLVDFKQRVEGTVLSPDGRVTDELILGREDEWNFEGGGDYEFGIGPGRLKLIGLQRLEHSPTSNSFGRTDRAPAAVTFGNRFDQIVDEGESILRGEYRWKGGPADWQVSLEGAYNTLDSEQALFVRDAAGVEQPIALDDPNAQVSEKRAESIVSYGRPLGKDVTIQASLGGEYSEITVSGAGGETRRFVRPKGSLSASWKFDPTLTFNAKVERRVDQLSFFDFLASVDVANDTGNASNPELVPPQVWRAELEAVKQLGPWGSFSILGAAARATDIVDQIPISPTAEARGNLPSADLVRVTGKATILLDPLGWKGAKLDFDGTWQDSWVADPLTGEIRELSDRARWFYEANLRHDIPSTDWAWGAGLFDEKAGRSYRLDQVAQPFFRNAFATVFVEHKDIAGLTVRASLRNLLDRTEGFTRTVYEDRRDGPVAFVETRARKFGPIVAFQVSGKI